MPIGIFPCCKVINDIDHIRNFQSSIFNLHKSFIRVIQQESLLSLLLNSLKLLNYKEAERMRNL